MYDITCSIVLYHNPIEEVKKAVNSFLGCNKNIRLYLIDNSTTDDFRFEFSSPQIEYLFNGKNIGFGAAHNIAIKRIMEQSKYHIILNPDVEFDPNILSTLFDYMEMEKRTGLLMPKVLYPTGEIQHLCKFLPSPTDLFMRRFLPGPLKSLISKQLEKYELRHKDYNTIMDVPNLSGCFMFIRTEVFRTVGLFDEQYFMYLEDTDLCRRINQQFRTVYFPKEHIIHRYSKASYKNLKLLIYHIHSSILYFNKWGWLRDDFRASINRTLDHSREMAQPSIRTYSPSIS